MGIGDPGLKLWADYVLEPFSEEEQLALSSFINKGVEALKCLLKAPVLQVMNEINAI